MTVNPEAMRDLRRLCRLVGRRAVLEMLRRERIDRLKECARMVLAGSSPASPTVREFVRQEQAMAEACRILTTEQP